MEYGTEGCHEKMRTKSGENNFNSKIRILFSHSARNNHKKNPSSKNIKNAHETQQRSSIASSRFIIANSHRTSERIEERGRNANSRGTDAILCALAHVYSCSLNRQRMIVIDDQIL